MFGGILSRVARIFNPGSNRAYEIGEVLNDNKTTTPWNAERLAHAQSLVQPTENIIKNTRNNLKEILWDTPISWGKKFLSTVNNLTFLPVTKLAVGIKGKVEAVPKLALSGALVTTTHALEILDKPFKFILDTHKKINDVINKKAA